MAHEISKARRVGRRIVVTLPGPVADSAGLKPGDALIVQRSGRDGVTLIREGSESVRPVKMLERLEREIDLLELQKQEILARRELELVKWKIGWSEPGLDSDFMDVGMAEVRLRLAELEARIAEKRLDLEDLRAAIDPEAESEQGMTRSLEEVAKSLRGAEPA